MMHLHFHLRFTLSIEPIIPEIWPIVFDLEKTQPKFCEKNEQNRFRQNSSKVL